MSAQIYSAQTYRPARRFPLANAVNQPNQLLPATTPQKPRQKPKQPPSPPLQRQNINATPPSPPSIIRDKQGYLQFHKVGFLGEGGFARVYEAEDSRGTRVACKVVSRSSLTTKKTKTKLYAEIRIHKSLSHPNIVTFQECFEGDENVYMILELCTSGSLMDLLRRRKRLTEPEARFFLVQIIGACHYMHTYQVIHRDLKLGNIFLDAKMNVKVGDFGLAALIENPGERKKTICGTPNYIAPEVLFDTANGHSFEVDTWSIGVILYTLIIGRPPFQTKEVKAIYKRIRDNEYEFPSERPISAAAQDLIQLILTPNPQERPALLDVVHDSFFARNTFPSYIPTSAHDFAPDFRSVTRSVSETNFRRVRRAALLDPDQVLSIAAPFAPDPGPLSPEFTFKSVSSAIAQQEKEFQKAVQPGSPISALLSSAKRPLLRSTAASGAPAAVATREAPLFRKLQAASSSSTVPTNPSPLRQSSGVARPVSRHAAAPRELGHIEEEDDKAEESGKKRKNRTKELEAQKARIVAQMAPVKEDDDRNEEDVLENERTVIPRKGDIKRRSVKENRIPVPSAPAPAPAPAVAGSRSRLTGFDTAAQVLTLAFEARAAGKVFRDPRENPRLPLPDEDLFIVSWVDYCNKYGMGYAMTDGSVGVHFNDSTSAILSADKHHFDLISSRRNGSVYVRKSYTVEEYPQELEAKVYLLQHFERYIMARLWGEYDYTWEDKEKTKGMVWLQNYLRMKQVIVFKLSHDVLQFNFYDHSKIILSSSGLTVTHIDKNSVLTRWTLSDIMLASLQMAALPPTDANQVAIKLNQRLVDKLKYCKEVLVSIRSASTTSSGAAVGSSNMGPSSSALSSSGMSLHSGSSKASLR